MNTSVLDKRQAQQQLLIESRGGAFLPSISNNRGQSVSPPRVLNNIRGNSKIQGLDQHLSRNNNYQGIATNASNNLDSSLLTIQLSSKRRKSVGYYQNN